MFKKEIRIATRGKKLDCDPNTEYIEVHYIFQFEKAFTKSGKIAKRRYDIDDHVKLFQDAIFESLNIDDSFVLRLTAEKRHGPGMCYALITVKDRK